MFVYIEAFRHCVKLLMIQAKELQVGHGYSKSFVGKVLFRIKWKFELTLH